MKKAKIMLTAVGILAVIGGALAFNAQRSGLSVFCGDGSGNTACTTTISDPEGYKVTSTGNSCNGTVAAAAPALCPAAVVTYAIAGE